MQSSPDAISPELFLQWDKGDTSMSIEDNKAIARRLYEEALNMGNLAVVDELVAPSIVLHYDYAADSPGPMEPQSGLEAIKHFVSHVRTPGHGGDTEYKQGGASSCAPWIHTLEGHHWRSSATGTGRSTGGVAQAFLPRTAEPTAD
jgi:hypothetical protein